MIILLVVASEGLLELTIIDDDNDDCNIKDDSNTNMLPSFLLMVDNVDDDDNDNDDDDDDDDDNDEDDNDEDDNDDNGDRNRGDDNNICNCLQPLPYRSDNTKHDDVLTIIINNSIKAIILKTIVITPTALLVLRNVILHPATTTDNTSTLIIDLFHHFW